MLDALDLFARHKDGRFTLYPAGEHVATHRGVLADDEWADRMTAVDHRGPTPLFWTHVAPYGEVRLNMDRRLSLRAEA